MVACRLAEDPLCGGRIQPFGKRRQYHCDLLGGGFQAIQGGVAPSTQRGVASQTAKRLDALSKAMKGTAKGMNVSVCDPEVRAPVVGASETLGVHPFWCSPSGSGISGKDIVD